MHWMFVVAAVFGQAALADEPGPDAKTLGITEAVVSYCAKVDPKAASHYQERIKKVAQGAGEERLAKLRLTDEYQKAHASVDDFVDKIDERNSKKFCADPHEQKK